MIALELLQKVCPKTKKEVLEKFVAPLNDQCKKAGIFENKNRAAAFLAQIAHESGGFNFVKENLNYGAPGLMATFKKYFPTEDLAKQYERKPEMIANRVYASRMGNGDEKSGEGFKFRGRGLIQLTGKDNYTRLSTALGKSIDETVAYMETTEGAVAGAVWFWTANHLNDIADKNDFVLLTKKINGGTIGLEDRKHHFQVALESIQV